MLHAAAADIATPTATVAALKWFPHKNQFQLTQWSFCPKGNEQQKEMA